MPKRLPFRTAIAGLTALAMAAPVIAPANTTVLSAAVAQAQAAPTLTGPNTVDINTAGSFDVIIDAPENGKIQFYLDGVPLDSPVSLGSDASQTVTKSITPTSYTNAANPHVVTVRYFDADGYTTRADAVKNFQTPLDLTKLFGQGPGRNDGEGTYTSSVNGQQRNISNPLEVEQNQEITLDASVSIGGTFFTWTDVYEVGINPPAGTTYVSGKRTDNQNTMLLTRGNGSGGYDRQPSNLSGVNWPSWGVQGYPSVTAGYFGIQRTDNYRESRTTPRVRGVFKAPSTPGIYVPQFAQFKYSGNTNHYLRPMENATFRVKAQRLPELNPRPGAQPIATTVSLDKDQTLTAGEPGPLNVTVTAGAKGTITLKNGESEIGSTTAIPADGKVTINDVRIDEDGSPAIKVIFIPAANSNFAESESEEKVTVKPAPVKTTASYTGDTSGTKGQPVKLKATLAPEDANGTVTFTSRGNTLKANVPVVNGVAEVEHTFTLPATYPVVAEFTPATDSNFVASKSDPVDVAIKDASTVELTLSQDTTVAGTPVTLTANTGPQLASGTVQFYDGDTPIDGPVTPVNRVATKNYTPKETGSRNIRAVFTPTGNYNQSEDSKSLEVTEAPVGSTVTLADVSPFTVDQPGSLTAEVGPDGVEGTVEFYNGDASDPANKLGEAPVSNGTATLNDVIFDTDGEKTINLVFAPTGEFEISRNSGTVTVNPAAQPQPEAKQTALTVKSDKTEATTAEDVKLTATVDPAAAGTVQFKRNGENLGKPVTVTNGNAVLTQKLPAGANNITAEFTSNNTAEFTNSNTSQAVTVQVNQVQLGTTVAFEGPQRSLFGKQMQMTATVTDENGQPVNGGTVQFILEGTPLDPPIEVKDGKAVYPKTYDQPGQEGEHTLGLKYIPAATSNYKPSQTQEDATFTVYKTGTTTTYTGPTSSPYGDQMQMAASIVDENGQPVNSGQARFILDGNALAPLIDVKNGKAVYPKTYNNPGEEGQHTIQVKYIPAPKSQYAKSETAPAEFTVVKPDQKTAPAVTVSAPTGEKTTDDDITLTAKVDPASAGTVEFFNGTDKIDGTVNYDPATGEATLTTKLAEGDYTVTATFTPADDNTTALEASSQPAAQFTVKKKEEQQPPTPEATAPTVTVTAPTGDTTTDDEVTLTAKVDPASAGTVEFFNGADKIDGTVNYDPATGEATLTTKLAEGDYTVTAKFTPATDNTTAKEASSQAAPTFTVKKKEEQQPPAPEATAPAVTVTAPTGDTTTDDEVTLTAKVDPASAGTVEFFNGTTSLGTAPVNNGTATLTKKLAEGDYTVTAKFTPATDNTTALEATSQPAAQFTVKKKEEQQPPAPEAKKTELTLQATENAKAGDTVTVTATIDQADAEGTVEFFNGTQSLGKKQVTGGTATATFTPETAGTHEIKAVFTPADATKFVGDEKTTKVDVAAVTPPVTEGTVPAVEKAEPVRGEQGKDTVLTARVKAGTQGRIKFTLTDGTEIGSATINPDGTATINYPFTKPGAYAVQAYYVAPDGTVSGEASDVFTVTVAAEEKTGSSEGPSKNEKSSIDGPNRPWIITGITLAVTALAAGVGFFFLNNPAVKNFLAQFGIRY